MDQRHQGHHLGWWNGQRCGRCWGSFGEASGAQGRICFYSLRWGGGGGGGWRRGESLKLAFSVCLFFVILKKEPYCFLVYLWLIASRILFVLRLGLSVCLEHVLKTWEIWGLKFVVVDVRQFLSILKWPCVVDWKRIANLFFVFKLLVMHCFTVFVHHSLTRPQSWVQSVAELSLLYLSTVCVHGILTRPQSWVQSVADLSSVYLSTVCVHGILTRPQSWVQSVAELSSLYLSTVCVHCSLTRPQSWV